MAVRITDGNEDILSIPAVFLNVGVNDFCSRSLVACLTRNFILAEDVVGLDDVVKKVFEFFFQDMRFPYCFLFPLFKRKDQYDVLKREVGFSN